MTETSKRERRKSKGKLSVLDEFADDAGEIVFSPTLNPDELAAIETRTRLADVPHFSGEQISNQQSDGTNNLWTELKNKPSSNVVQTSAKHSSEPSSNVVQTSARVEPVEQALSFKPSSKPSSEPSSNVVQTPAKPSSNFEFDRLSPIQQRLILFLAEESQKNRSQISSALNGSLLADRLGCGLEGLRTAVKRLTKVSFVEIVEVKAGKTGWTRYRLAEHVFQTMIRNQTWFNSSSNIVQTSAKPSSKSSSEPSSESPSSSRDLYSKESSTTQMAPISDELSSLDVSGLREYGITLETFKRAVQLYPNVTIEALSDLAYRLSELLKQPKERAKIQNARGFVIKLVEQLAGGVTPLDHIETAHERLMREYAQAAAKKRSEQQGYEESLLQAAFEKWDQETELDAKFQAVPLAQRAPAGSPRSAIFREYFREKLWPIEREELLKGQA